MATTIQIKRSTGSSDPSSLAAGELAYTLGNNKLFIGDGSSPRVIGGKVFSDKLDHTDGILTASSAITTDSNSKVDTIKLKGADNSTPGNIVLDDNDSDYATTLKGAATLGGNIDITLPATAGTVITTGNLSNVAGTIGTLTALTVDNVLIGSADNQTISTSSGVLKLNPATDIDAVSNNIINVATPTAAHHATNKGYVDGLIQGLDVKGSVRTASTANGTLSSDFANGDSVGGVTVATGDRILIKEQSTGSENGVYTVNASGAPTRATDFDSNAGITAGAFVFVEQGTVNAENGFVCTSNKGSAVVGTNNLVFAQFSGAGQIIAGDGMDKSGNTLSVDLKSSLSL